ncbi:MAG: putative serine protease PepD [Streptomyces sp.]|nr:putative serine protease PepD [Streptomyces sp.]
MTESNRYSGEPQYPHDPQLPLYYGPQADAPQASAPQPQGGEPLQSALPAAQGTRTLDPFGAAPEESAGDGGDGSSASGFPPPPPYDPTPPAGDSSPHRRRKAGRPLALFAAVALVAGAIGGGAGALVGNATASDSTSSTATTSSVVNAAAIDGSVSGVAKADSPSVVEITATSSVGEAVGSGVILTSNGQVITNNHVVTGATSIKIAYSDGKTATATIVGTDTAKDLALIQITGASGLTPAALGDSSTIAVGDQVVAIGSPEDLAGTVTSGIVSALNRDVTVPTEEQTAPSTGDSGGQQWPFSSGGQQYNGGTSGSTTTYKAIQTDASLNPGNSGGGLFNMSGQVIGINSAMYSASSSTSSSDAGSMGLGFAIPINTVKSDLSYLQGGGDNN